MKKGGEKGEGGGGGRGGGESKDHVREEPEPLNSVQFWIWDVCNKLTIDKHEMCAINAIRKYEMCAIYKL